MVTAFIFWAALCRTLLVLLALFPLQLALPLALLLLFPLSLPRPLPLITITIAFTITIVITTTIPVAITMTSTSVITITIPSTGAVAITIIIPTIITINITITITIVITITITSAITIPIGMTSTITITIVFWPYLKTVNFKNGVPGVLNSDVFNYGHTIDAFFGPCWGLYLANGARKSRHRIKVMTPVFMSMNTGAVGLYSIAAACGPTCCACVTSCSTFSGGEGGHCLHLLLSFSSKTTFDGTPK